MAALIAARDTRRVGDQFPHGPKAHPVLTNTVIYGGSIVCTNAAGFAVPGAVATTLKAVGVAVGTVNNNPGASGAKSVEAMVGEFYFNNATAGDLITQADVGNQCWILDDNTVAKTDGSAARSVAGVITAVDAYGVAVLIGAGLKT